MLEHLNLHEELFVIVIPIVLILIYYYYFEIDYKFLYILSTYYYVFVPSITLPFYVYISSNNDTGLQNLEIRFIIQQYVIFLIFVILCTIFLFLGDKSFKRKVDSKSFLTISETRSFKYYVLFFFLLGVYLFIKFQDNLFEGYLAKDNWPRHRSWIIGIVSISIAMYAFYVAENKENIFRRYFFNFHFLIALTFCFLYLTAGGRHLILILLTVIFLELAKEKISLLISSLFSGFLILFLGFVGALRTGSSVNNYLPKTSIEIFGETNNVSNTMFSFITNTNVDKYQIIEFPLALISQLFNLIPSIIYPEKTTLMFSHHYVSHFQATSIIFVDTLVNFGVLGSFFVFWLIGYSMQYLKFLSPAIFLAVSALFALNLHRTFEVTLIKNVLQYSIILPLLIIVTDRIFKYFNLIKD